MAEIYLQGMATADRGTGCGLFMANHGIKKAARWFQTIRAVFGYGGAAGGETKLTASDPACPVNEKRLASFCITGWCAGVENLQLLHWNTPVL